MEITQYILITITTILGLLAGVIISSLTKDEQKLSKKYLHSFVIPTNQTIVYAAFGIIFAFLSQTKWFSLAASLIFLYSITVGSFLFVEKRNKEFFSAGGIFLLTAFITRAILSLA